MEEKIVERIIEMLKEPDFHIVEGALKGLTELADVEFKSILNDIIVERWIQTPKDVPFSYACMIWNRKDVPKLEYKALLKKSRVLLLHK